MRSALKLHPDSRCETVTRIAAQSCRALPGSLSLHYLVEGRIADIVLPPVSEPKRTNELWRHSCFEAFLRANGSDAYYEFNFASSTQWAAYRFDGYRSGMEIAEEIDTPGMDVIAELSRFELHATLALDRLPDLANVNMWQLGLSVVIEEIGGNIAHWALAHPPGKPDFHHSDCFALELTAA